MAKFRKKPVIIEAVQLTEDVAWANVLDGQPLPFGLHRSCSGYHAGDRRMDYFEISIETLEGKMRAELGDWIIKGVAGELYPCKPDIFEQTYEKVE